MNIFKSKKEKPTAQNSDTVRAAYEILQRYKAGKASVEARIIENEEWYRQQLWLACDERTTILGHPWYHPYRLWYHKQDSFRRKR